MSLMYSRLSHCSPRIGQQSSDSDSLTWHEGSRGSQASVSASPARQLQKRTGKRSVLPPAAAPAERSGQHSGTLQEVVGHALGLLRGYSGLTREMVFLSTKAGFLSQADVDGLLQSRAMDAGDLVQGTHCLHPACLDFSLKRSLARMNVGTVGLRPACAWVAPWAGVTCWDGM